jgi:hypothetical protein
MSKTYRHNPSDDWEDYAQKKAGRPARPSRPIGDDRTYRVTSKRRNALDYDKFVAAMARYVLTQAEADADANPNAAVERHHENPAQERGKPEASETGGSDE